MISVRLFFLVIIVRYLQPVLNDICSNFKNESLCQTYSEEKELVCARELWNKYDKKVISTLSLCYWSEANFNPQILSDFPNLERFSLIKSSVKTIEKPFEDRPALQMLNISYNVIEQLLPLIFDKLQFLKVLDLRYNKLHQLEASMLKILPNLQNVFLVGNQWYCEENFLWITKQSNFADKIITDVDLLMCKGPKYNGKPLKQTMNMLETLNSQCSKMSDNCTCTLEHIVRVANNLRPMITVNCSNQNLNSLPHILPKFTSTLVVRGNMISSLDEFINNENYFHLLNVYLDYNNISSINVLEGSSWLLSSFRALSLKGNKLTEVPIYVLEYAFEKNRNVANLFLSENPWKCDCIFTPSFKDFLAKYRKIIKDVHDIKCAYREGDENSLVSISSLSRNKICYEDAIFKISFLKILNVCMTVLLAIILFDFTYNYYMYKKYSRLPWIVRKFS
ncbi:hypothetical protein PGB90_000062 [Kerria lacca]